MSSTSRFRRTARTLPRAGDASGGRPAPADAPLRIGVSACLLGRNVRFDGGHKRDALITERLAPFARFVSVCPEIELGLGAPRESMRLIRGGAAGPRLVAPKSGADHSAAMRRYAAEKLEELVRAELSGFILKKDSPTCGMERVRVYDSNGVPARDGVGVFAQALLERLPLLPVEDEGRLHDPRLRENFFERVFAYRRVRDLFAGPWTLGDLVRFHSGEKLLLLAHDPERYRLLGRLVAQAKGLERGELARTYERELMSALRRIATTGRHVNVLQHVVGYFRERLPQPAREELAGVIEDFRRGLVPLIVPVTLIRHHVRALDVSYLDGQVYLEPHPKELMLRNYV